MCAAVRYVMGDRDFHDFSEIHEDTEGRIRLNPLISSRSAGLRRAVVGTERQDELARSNKKEETNMIKYIAVAVLATGMAFAQSNPAEARINKEVRHELV